MFYLSLSLMLNFEKGLGSWTIVTKYSISSNNMLSFWIHFIISYAFPLFHLSFTISSCASLSDSYPLSLKGWSILYQFYIALLNTHFHNFKSLNFTHNFGLSQVQSHQRTMVHNFTFTQSKQENNSTKLWPFNVTYIQNEHYALSQSCNPTITTVIIFGLQNLF